MEGSEAWKPLRPFQKSLGSKSGGVGQCVTQSGRWQLWAWRLHKPPSVPPFGDYCPNLSLASLSNPDTSRHPSPSPGCSLDLRLPDPSTVRTHFCGLSCLVCRALSWQPEQTQTPFVLGDSSWGLRRWKGAGGTRTAPAREPCTPELPWPEPCFLCLEIQSPSQTNQRLSDDAWRRGDLGQMAEVWRVCSRQAWGQGASPHLPLPRSPPRWDSAWLLLVSCHSSM